MSKKKSDEESLSKTSKAKTSNASAKDVFAYWDLERTKSAKPLSMSIPDRAKKRPGKPKPIEKDHDNG